MQECVKTINKYYTNLDYHNNKMEAQEQMSNLCKTLQFKETDKLSHRYFHTASLMQNNLNCFILVCEHIDVFTNIIDYFNFTATTIELNNINSITNTLMNIPIILTICNMFQDDKMQLFLETAIINESQMDIYNSYKQNIMLNVDMILLEDSDLYAVINCLKFKSVMNVVSKILVQESIMQTFMWYCEKYFKYNFEFVKLKTFQSLKDLLTLNDLSICNFNTVNMVSIWSEDIIAAKNLAESLKHNVLCINTCMDFEPGLMLPYLELNRKSLNHSLHLYEVREYTCADPRNPITHQGVKYDLFYDGKWQTPIRKKYWMHNNILFANATREDIVKCATSAGDGFKIWSTMSNHSRRQILYNFAIALESENKPQFVDAIKNMVYFSYFCEYQMNCSIMHNNVEISLIYAQQGTAILQEKDPLSLVMALTLNLVFGNSVIVICNPDLYFLAQFCNVFKMCGIPPGVINLLSMENADFEYDIISGMQINQVYSSVSVTQYMLVAC